MERHGLQAMLSCGQWRSPQNASYYASIDEMDRFVLGSMVADASEDDA